MTGKRFIVKLGTGTDLPGQDVTKTATRAVKNAISRSCLCDLVEIVELEHWNEMEVEILVAVLEPERINDEEVLKAIPFGTKRIQIVPGGLSAPDLYVEELGGESETMVVVNAAVTVRVKGAKCSKKLYKGVIAEQLKAG
jgi:uncharacterized protein (TIGR02058 family)